MKESIEKLKKLCIDGMKQKGLFHEQGIKRFELEFKNITDLEEENYFLNLVIKKLKFTKNENNLLIAYVLGLCEDFDISKEPEWYYGEAPDIDVDYISEVRDYLKREWAPKQFGPRNVCPIGNYGTFGIKSSLIDMAKIFGKDRHEILSITTSIEDKDDEGKPIKWDKALEIYPELKTYCDNNPEVADAAKRLLDRNRSLGKHAGGLIVSSIPIDHLIPLIRNAEDSEPVSAFVEGLHGTDLGPLGFIKFDLLVVKDLQRINDITALVKKRHGLDSYYALPGQGDWSDDSYLNDPKSIAMANNGDLRGIFQFDSDGIRRMVKAGGVSNFDDIAAYSALYRPSALLVEGDKTYIKRKNGEEYTLHPFLEPILGKTYGVMLYQEQVMKILNMVGEIPLTHCEKARKAISKKVEEQILAYKDALLKNGKEKLQYSDEEIEDMWEQIVSWSGYGFNKCISAGTIIGYDKNKFKPIENFVAGDCVYSIDEYGNKIETKVVKLHNNGIMQGCEVTFDDGYSVVCSLDHKFLTKNGQKSLREILGNNYNILCYMDKEICAQENRLVDKVRTNSFEQKGVLHSFENMPEMSRDAFHNGELGISLRNEIQKQNFGKATRAEMYKLSEVEGCGKGACVQMWSGFRRNREIDKTSENVSTMQFNQERKYQEKKYDSESISWASNIFFESSPNYIGQTRDSSRTSKEIGRLEGVKPRKVCQDYRERMEESEEFQNGDVAGEANWMERNICQIRRKCSEKTSRFCKGQHLDRGRRSSSFFRLLAEEVASAPDELSGAGRHVKRRGFEKKYHSVSSEHGMFCDIDRSDENGVVGSVAEYAEVSNARHLVSRKIIRIMPVGERQMYDLEVAISTHNFLLPNGIVTSNSHSYSYGHISSRLLNLKAHFPIEFFAGTLANEADSDKIKEYKLEAERHGVKLQRVDINKSGWNFQIVDDSIYMGFSNVKGIGEEVAKKIVAGQPYSSFDDFLKRFGTASSALKPLIGLGVFDCFCKDREKLWEFAEFCKDGGNKRNARDKRAEQSRKKLVDEFTVVALNSGANLGCDLLSQMTAFEDYNEMRRAFCGMDENECHVDQLEGFDCKELWKISRKYKKNIESHSRKKSGDREVSFDEFVPTGEIDENLKQIYQEIPPVAEALYYGFNWSHVLEYSPDYIGGMTLSEFDDGRYLSLPVECQVIKAAEKRESKKKKGNFYYSMRVEDANSQQVNVNIWQEDFDRFKEEFTQWSKAYKGNLLRIRLERPSGGYPTYTFESPPKHLRDKVVPKEKEHDSRLIVMKFPYKAPPKESE